MGFHCRIQTEKNQGQNGVGPKMTFTTELSLWKEFLNRVIIPHENSNTLYLLSLLKSELCEVQEFVLEKAKS